MPLASGGRANDVGKTQPPKENPRKESHVHRYFFLH